jgi:hypothetical protein
MKLRSSGFATTLLRSNLGDIIKDGRDIYGDGVNVAARLEALAEPGGICRRLTRSTFCSTTQASAAAVA